MSGAADRLWPHLEVVEDNGRIHFTNHVRRIGLSPTSGASAVREIIHLLRSGMTIDQAAKEARRPVEEVRRLGSFLRSQSLVERRANLQLRLEGPDARVAESINQLVRRSAITVGIPTLRLWAAARHVEIGPLCSADVCVASYGGGALVPTVDGDAFPVDRDDPFEEFALVARAAGFIVNVACGVVELGHDVAVLSATYVRFGHVECRAVAR